MAIDFTIDSVSEISQKNGEHNIFEGRLDVAPLASYQRGVPASGKKEPIPQKVIVICKVANANSDKDNWTTKNITQKPLPKTANYTQQEIQLEFSLPDKKVLSAPSTDYCIVLTFNDPLKENCQLTIVVDEQLTTDPVRKTRIILSNSL